MSFVLSIKENIADILFSEEMIRARVQKLADKLVDDLSDSTEPPIFIVIMGGAIHFFSDLTRFIGDRMQIEQDFMVLKSYEEDESSGVAKILIDLRFSITGRDVVIVEDIIDTGITMQEILNLLRSRNPHSIRTCVFLNKIVRRKVKNIQVDYVGFEVGDHFVVGYGLDSRQGYRHLPYIGILK